MIKSIALVILFSFIAGSLAGQDLIHLKTGETAAVKLEALTDNIATFSLFTGAAVPGGSAERTIPADRIEYIEFRFQKGEKEIFGSRETLDSATLKSWWDSSYAHLHRPRSRTARYGIAFAEALLRENPNQSAKRALGLFDLIIERAWSPDDINLAKRGRLQSLIALGELDTAVEEAQSLATETEDPELLIEVKFLLAESDFQQLEQLLADNPRWEEDDEIRPEIKTLYHEVLDQYLWAHLFHATRTESAARGLLGASSVYLAWDDSESARNACEDLLALYPKTTFAEVARERLETLVTESTPTSKDTL